jgi:threonine dehydratase
VFLKCENYQRGGAFKFRGAYNKVSSLSREDLDRGVISLSSGNHAQALALSARLCKTNALVLMPQDVAMTKLAATRGYGADVLTFDRYATDFDDLLQRVAQERCMTIVHPFDDWMVIAGQGTVALELIQKVRDVDLMLVPVGGGGLIAGCAIAAKALLPKISIIGVEPEEGDDVRRSLRAGRRIRINVPQTIADGQQLPTPGELTFEVIRRHVDDIVTVTDVEIISAMAFLFERMKVVAEPSGASALAALLSQKVQVAGLRTGVIISGGNVGLARFCDLTSAEAAIVTPTRQDH